MVKFTPWHAYAGTEVGSIPLETSVLEGGGRSAPSPGCFNLGKDPVPIVQEVGCASGLVWMGTEDLTPTRNQFPDHPAHSESLYQLHYPSHLLNLYNEKSTTGFQTYSASQVTNQIKC